MTESILPLTSNTAMTPNTTWKELGGLEEEYPNTTKAFDLFKLEYRKYAQRKDLKHFADKYLHSTASEKNKKRYLKKMLPNLSKEEREQYISNIYCCRFCDRYFPLWYVSDAEWEKTGKQFEKLIWSIACGFKEGTPEFKLPCVEVVQKDDRFEYIQDEKNDPVDPNGIRPPVQKSSRKHKYSGLYLCKECYENLFNSEPHYIDVEESERELPADSWKYEPPQAYFDWRKKRLSVVWDLPALNV
jgi:hypothetical protein